MPKGPGDRIARCLLRPRLHRRSHHLCSRLHHPSAPPTLHHRRLRRHRRLRHRRPRRRRPRASVRPPKRVGLTEMAASCQGQPRPTRLPQLWRPLSMLAPGARRPQNLASRNAPSAGSRSTRSLTAETSATSSTRASHTSSCGHDVTAKARASSRARVLGSASRSVARRRAGRCSLRCAG